MKWIGIYPSADGAHVTEAMITPSRGFKIWNDYYSPHGKYAGTWHGNLALLRTGVGTILRRSDDIKGVILIDPEIDNASDQFVRRMDQAIGALATSVMDWAGWETPFLLIPFSLLVKFSIGKSKKDTVTAMDARARSEYNYKARSTDECLTLILTTKLWWR